MMNKVLLILLVIFPCLAFASGSDQLKLKLSSQEIESKELKLSEQLKEQETDRMIKKYPSGSMIKVEKVDPNDSFNKNNPYFSGKHTEFTDKNDIKTYKKDPAAKQDKGIGVKVTVPLTD
jgi:hypothetical protein